MTTVIIGLAVFAHVAVNQLGGGYLEYRQTARQTIAINAYVEDLFEARIAALKYRNQPSNQTRQDTIDNINEITNGTTYLEPFESNGTRLAQVEELVGLTAEYGDGFIRAADLTASANTIRDTFSEQIAMLDGAVLALLAAGSETGNVTGDKSLSLTISTYMRSSLATNQYLLSGNPIDRDAALQLFAEFRNQLDTLSSVNMRPQIETIRNLTTGYQDQLLAFSDASQAAKSIEINTLDRIGPEVQDRFDTIVNEIVDRQNELGPEGASIVQRLTTIIPATGVLATLVAILSAFVIGRWIAGSVRRLADTTSKLASGENNISIVGAEYQHELGQVARALEVFRDAQLAREQAEQEREAMQKSQQEVVQTMLSELSLLAKGDLTVQIDREFDPQYEQLRLNFNSTVDALQGVITKLAETSSIIRSTTVQTNTATDELSQRTENQAATLEQTAASLDELTASVRSAADHAKSVNSSVNRARSEAEKNGVVVSQAVSAMGEIAESSKQITQVITVIEDIAFQTNLLALNAGVEAARAGESGRGFAVVASEVRALAQRSAEAAKEIAELIANSSEHVKKGTQLVGNAGTALSEIIKQVNDIADMTSQIAGSSAEQSIGLSEINVGVNQLDQVTQQNAAMVQASMSRGEELARETETLNTLVAKFKTAHDINRSIAEFVPQDALSIAIDRTNQTDDTSVPTRKIAVSGGTSQDAVWADF